jgi:hypothetical protein
MGSCPKLAPRREILRSAQNDKRMMVLPVYRRHHWLLGLGHWSFAWSCSFSDSSFFSSCPKPGAVSRLLAARKRGVFLLHFLQDPHPQPHSRERPEGGRERRQEGGLWGGHRNGPGEGRGSRRGSGPGRRDRGGWGDRPPDRRGGRPGGRPRGRPGDIPPCGSRDAPRHAGSGRKGRDSDEEGGDPCSDFRGDLPGPFPLGSGLGEQGASPVSDFF